MGTFEQLASYFEHAWIAWAFFGSAVIAVVGLVVAIKSRGRRRLAAVLPFILFLVGGTHLLVRYPDELEASMLAIFNPLSDDAPWKDQDEPGTGVTPSGTNGQGVATQETVAPISHDMIKRAALLAHQLLIQQCASQLTANELSRAEAFFMRMPDLVDQRIYFDATRNEVDYNHDQLGVLAETVPGLARPFCLYVGAIEQWWEGAGLGGNPDGQVVALAWLLLHEACHLPFGRNGWIATAVPGDQVEQAGVGAPRRLEPNIQHIGLNYWGAVLAHQVGHVTQGVDAPTDAERAGHCAEVTRVYRLITAANNVYSGVLRQRLIASTSHGRLEPVGPPAWHSQPLASLPVCAH